MQCKLLLHSPNHQMILNEMIYLNWFYLQNANVLRKYFLNICINTYPVTIFLLFKIWILALQKIADGRLHNTTISTPFLDNDIENTSYRENRNDDTDERTSIMDVSDVKNIVQYNCHSQKFMVLENSWNTS